VFSSHSIKVASLAYTQELASLLVLLTPGIPLVLVLVHVFSPMNSFSVVGLHLAVEAVPSVVVSPPRKSILILHNSVSGVIDRFILRESSHISLRLRSQESDGLSSGDEIVPSLVAADTSTASNLGMYARILSFRFVRNGLSRVGV